MLGRRHTAAAAVATAAALAVVVGRLRVVDQVQRHRADPRPHRAHTVVPRPVAGSATPTTITAGAPNSVQPCGVGPAPARYAHVIWIWMENHSYRSIIGRPTRLHQQLGPSLRAGHQLPQHHPPQPAQLRGRHLGPRPVGARAVHSRLHAVGQVQHDRAEHLRAGRDLEGLRGIHALELHPPTPASTRSATTRRRTSPPSPCPVNDVPYPGLAADLDGGHLPAFSFITPNLINDMHDGTVADGDHWLALNLGAILDSATYHAGTTAVFVTWDEGEGGSSNDCATNTTDVGCHIPTLVISPSTPAGATSEHFVQSLFAPRHRRAVFASAAAGPGGNGHDDDGRVRALATARQARRRRLSRPSGRRASTPRCAIPDRSPTQTDRPGSARGWAPRHRRPVR